MYGKKILKVHNKNIWKILLGNNLCDTIDNIIEKVCRKHKQGGQFYAKDESIRNMYTEKAQKDSAQLSLHFYGFMLNISCICTGSPRRGGGF